MRPAPANVIMARPNGVAPQAVKWLVIAFLVPAAYAPAPALGATDAPAPPKSESGRKPECRFEALSVPEGAVIYAAGAYAGRETGFQIDQSGHRATQFDIAVNSKDHPVVLMLGAYEPTVWNLGWSAGTRILAVLASGYHRQVVAGLEDGVPTLISTHDNKGPCGHFFVVNGNNPSLNPLSRRLFGKPVDLVYPGDTSGRIVIGEPLAAADELVTSRRNTPESYRDESAPLAGQAGLEEAVAKGVIRPATGADVDRWINETAAAAPPPDVPPVAGGRVPKPRRPYLYRAYVVLKEFTFPAGLSGGNSATFFIEKGVPRPEGNPGHSPVYDFNTLECSGATCNR